MTSKSLWMDIEVAPEAEVLDGVHDAMSPSSARALPGSLLPMSSPSAANPLSSSTAAASAEA